MFECRAREPPENAGTTILHVGVPLKIARRPMLKVTCKHFSLLLEPF